MIVQRIIFNVKVGCMDKLLELMKAEIAKGTKKWRIYTPGIAPMDKLAAEVEFESLTECDKFWSDWFAAPGTPEFQEKQNALIETGGTNEIWGVVE